MVGKIGGFPIIIFSHEAPHQQYIMGALSSLHGDVTPMGENPGEVANIPRGMAGVSRLRCQNHHGGKPTTCAQGQWFSWHEEPSYVLESETQPARLFYTSLLL
jgi:hypothetical protein